MAAFPAASLVSIASLAGLLSLRAGSSAASLVMDGQAYASCCLSRRVDKYVAVLPLRSVLIMIVLLIRQYWAQISIH